PLVPRERAALAIVLPLGSPTYAGAAEAVHAGFLAAAENAKQRFTVIAHGDGGVRAALDQAKDLGAHVMIGPLLRDDLKTIGAAEDLPWTIALNQVDESTPLSTRIYTLALSIESEGRQLAHRVQK